MQGYREHRQQSSSHAIGFAIADSHPIGCSVEACCMRIALYDKAIFAWLSGYPLCVFYQCATNPFTNICWLYKKPVAQTGCQRVP